MRKILGCVALASLVAGCSMIPELVVANNSGSTIVLTSARERYQIEVGGRRSFIDSTLPERMRILRGGTNGAMSSGTLQRARDTGGCFVTHTCYSWRPMVGFMSFRLGPWCRS